MKFSKRISVIAAGAALAAGLAPSLAQADAVAQSILNVTNFTFRTGDGELGLGGAFLPNLGSLVASTTADAFAALEGFAPDTGSAIPGGRRADVGQTAFYMPGTFIAGAPTSTYVGSQATQIGNAAIASTDARVDNTVTLAPVGDGTAQGNVNLNADYTLNIATAGTKVEVRFDAELWLRAMLDNNGSATAASSWVMTIKNNLGSTIFRWSPDGGANGITGGIEYADSFALTDSVSRLTAGNAQTVEALANFEAETFGLGIGTYTLSVRHSGNADARLVPEPGSIALLSVALLGAGFAARRRNSK